MPDEPNNRMDEALRKVQRQQRALLPEVKHLRRNILLDLHVSLGRAHVLPKGDHIDLNLPQFPQRVPDLLFRLAGPGVSIHPATANLEDVFVTIARNRNKELAQAG